MIYFLMADETFKSSNITEFLKLLSNFIREIQTNSSIYKTTISIIKSMTAYLKAPNSSSQGSPSQEVKPKPKRLKEHFFVELLLDSQLMASFISVLM
jgi:hypothetical protein